MPSACTLDGQGSTLDTFLQRFPADALGDPELAVVTAYRELTQRSLEKAAASIAVAERNAGQVSGASGGAASTLAWP